MSSQCLWEHLPLLVRANSKELVEYILQALWRTRKIGLDAADRQIIRDMLNLLNDSDLDPLLVCLRILIRRCVYENVNKDEIQNLFPAEVLPELQRLLTLQLQKFQKEWREDVVNDQVILPHLKTMTWSMGNQDTETGEPVAVINLKLQSDASSNFNERDVKFQLGKYNIKTILKSMYCIREQLSDDVHTSDKNVDLETDSASSLSRCSSNAKTEVADQLIEACPVVLSEFQNENKLEVTSIQPRSREKASSPNRILGKKSSESTIEV